MRIICAGMRQAADMWLFNVVRSIMSTQGDVLACTESDLSYVMFERQVIKLLKYNEGAAFGADIVLTTCRDLRDVAVSARRKGIVPDKIRSIVAYLIKTADENESWNDVATACLPYESICKDELGSIVKISEYLKISIDPESIWRQIHSVVINQGIDSEIFATSRRYRDGLPGAWKHDLSKDWSAAIDLVFADWQSERGYKFGE